ncbi:hypothetical protein UE95_040710, partial [Burkholderia cenocepacia]
VLDEVTAERNAAQLDLARSLERERLLAEAKDDLSRSLEKERSERGALERTLESTNAFLQAQQEKFQVQQEEIVQMR